MMGGDAERILRRSRVPVLLVRAAETESKAETAQAPVRTSLAPALAFE
jgi:hypothetical protein